MRALIAASPEDLGLRLVYADLLLERNDPRGLFIQAQCRGDEVVARELLGRYRQHLLHPLPTDAEAVFHNGFVEAWSATAAEFRRAGRRLFRQAPVRALTVRAARRCDLEFIFGTPGLQRLEALSLPEVRVEPFDVLAAASLPALRRLAVSGRFTTESAAAFRATALAGRLEVCELRPAVPVAPPAPAGWLGALWGRLAALTR